MHIDELCKILKANNKDCLAFFSKVEDASFFKHFKNNDVFVFSPYLDDLMCGYILKCYKEKIATVKDIIDILRYNYNENNNDFQSYCVLPLFDILSLSEIEYQVGIPEHKLTHTLIKYLLKREMIERTGLIKKCLQYVDKNFI